MWQTGKTDANKLAAWGFDALAKGQQDTARRYDGGVAGKAYTQKVTSYDNLYQVTGSQLLLPDTDALVIAGVPKTLSFTTGYNLDGTVSQSSAPAVAGLAAETVSYTYNATGQQLTSKGTTGYLQGAEFSPQGDLRQLTLGMDGSSSAKKAYATWLYEDGTRRLTRAQVTDDVHSYPLQDLNFTQDDAGNVTSIFDITTQGGTAKADYQCFAYDGYRRMTEAWTPKTADCAATGRAMSNIDGAAPYWTSYTYNGGGQRQTETQHTASGDKTTTYKYDDTTDNKPHTLDKTTGATTGNYVYDSTGNTTSRPGPTAQQTLAWNTEGKLAGLTEGTKETSYLYDAGGELLIRRAKGDGDTILYLGGGTEARLTVKGTTKTLSGTRYYAANGQTIACRTAVFGTTGTKLSFLAADHHGTSNVAWDASTYAITKRYSTPFGASRGTKATTWPDDKAFLGKPADASTALTHVGAREYDPSIGQFLSVDPVLSVDQHQSVNGYSYAGNSPVTQSDPTGLQYPADQGGSGGSNGSGCYFVLTDPCGGVTTKPGGSGGVGGSGCYYVLTDACGTSGGGGGGGGGTSHTSSSGHTSGGGTTYSCSGMGPAEICRPNTGPQDTRTDVGNYLGSLLSNSDFWSGLLETAAGAFGATGGGLLVVSGAVECGTGVLCPVGAPSMAGGAGLAAAGVPLIQSGSDKLGRAFREADGKSSGGRGAQEQGDAYEEFLQEKLGGGGGFSEKGRQFDGAYVDSSTGRGTWYEAKSGRFFEDTLKNPKRLSKFYSTEGQKAGIASEYGIDYKVISENPIPGQITNWLTRKGIPWEVISK